MGNGPAQVIYHASPAMAEWRRTQALERLRTRKFGRYAAPTETTVEARRVVREAMRQARIGRAQVREGITRTPVPTITPATGATGHPCAGDLTDDYAVPTDPATGAMVTPDLPLPKYTKVTKKIGNTK